METRLGPPLSARSCSRRGPVSTSARMRAPPPCAGSRTPRPHSPLTARTGGGGKWWTAPLAE